MTFSLAGRCARTGMVGVAVSSSSPAVAARCAHVRAGVGAAASQNVTDPRLGTRLLDLMEGGAGAADAVARAVADAADAGHRQLTAVDAAGSVAAFTGDQALGVNAVCEGAGAVAAGNLLADTEVVVAMVRVFQETADRHLGDRLVAALAAGLEAGGEAGLVRSAGMLVADRVEWPVVDLRVDWHDSPIHELAVVWEVWKPQIDAYVTRALHPGAAPGYGVPGE